MGTVYFLVADHLLQFFLQFLMNGRIFAEPSSALFFFHQGQQIFFLLQGKQRSHLRNGFGIARSGKRERPARRARAGKAISIASSNMTNMTNPPPFGKYALAFRCGCGMAVMMLSTCRALCNLAAAAIVHHFPASHKHRNGNDAWRIPHRIGVAAAADKRKTAFHRESRTACHWLLPMMGMRRDEFVL